MPQPHCTSHACTLDVSVCRVAVQPSRNFTARNPTAFNPTTRKPTARRVAAQLRPKLTRDGKGLTELEFVLCMMLELEIVEWGKVTPFIAQFRLFDLTGTGRLGQDDLDLMARGERPKPASMDLASRSLSCGSSMNIVPGGKSSAKVAPSV